MKMLSTLVFLSLASAVIPAPLQPGADGTVTVQTEDGLLRGKSVTTLWNRTYISFQAVPYAQPPIGDLRFKSPKPVKPWTGVRDALTKGVYCTEDENGSTDNASEDCLYLNVYVPQVASSDIPAKGLTVLVYLAGGIHICGYGDQDIPDNLMNRTAIVVGINSRLGALGFLNIPHPEVTSNAALKDQVAALRWVKRNIANFGGNPDDVTIFGESAGGISVHLQMLTNLTTGLFQRAISESGSALKVDFRVGFNATREAFRLAEVIGFNGTSVDDLLKFLRSVSAGDIVKGQTVVANEENVAVGGLTSFLVVDHEIQEGTEVFLSDLPENLLRAGKVQPVPYITGINAYEGKFLVRGLTDADLENYNKHPELLIPDLLHIKNGSAEAAELGPKIKSFYFGNNSISSDTLVTLADVISDNFMIYPVYRAAMLQLAYGSAPIYMYEYTYASALGGDLPNDTIKGPNHGSDLSYILVDNAAYNPTSEDIQIIRHFTGMWVDFADSGNPSVHESVKWPAVTKTNHTYLQIDVNLSVHENLLKERMAFWDEVWATYKKE